MKYIQNVLKAEVFFKVDIHWYLIYTHIMLIEFNICPKKYATVKK